METSNERIIIVGGGHAGGVAAVTLRNIGFGGEVIVCGAETCPPAERPPYSKQFLASPVDQNAPPIRPSQWYSDHRVALRLGNRAIALDTGAKQIELADDQRLDYDRLILATGAKARTLNVPGAHLRNVFTLRTRDDAIALSRAFQSAERIAVIGAGFIGLEVAATARALGLEVTVIEAATGPLQRALIPAVANRVRRLHEARGVGFHFNATVSHIMGSEVVEGVVLEDGLEITTDAVVIGIGVDPETRIAAQAGLSTDDGILTDAFCQTSCRDIYAAGDCTRHFNPQLGRHVRLESWHNAQFQGEAAAKNAAGSEHRHETWPWVWSDQFDFRIEIAGLVETPTRSIVRESPDGEGVLVFQLTDEGTLVGAQSIDGGRDMKVARRLLGSVVPTDSLGDPDTTLRSLL